MLIQLPSPNRMHLVLILVLSFILAIAVSMMILMLIPVSTNGVTVIHQGSVRITGDELDEIVDSINHSERITLASLNDQVIIRDAKTQAEIARIAGSLQDVQVVLKLRGVNY